MAQRYTLLNVHLIFNRFIFCYGLFWLKFIQLTVGLCSPDSEDLKSLKLY